jgi:UDP-glucose 4-epimerase
MAGRRKREVRRVLAVLLIGGAGYIGSHMAATLLDRGEDVVVLDNLATGFRDAVPGGEFILGDFGDHDILDRLFRTHRFDAVFHFASFTLVGESVAAPGKYYRNNVANTIGLLEAMIAHGVGTFIFSSSAAVYGDAATQPIREDVSCRPVNPYGRTKRIVEEMLEDFAPANGLKWCALRYFNAAGADAQGRLGERHDPETHLIPLVLQAASGRRESISVFGRDHPTPDGTCIRDYVHVGDLCDAHWLALARLRGGGPNRCYNLGAAKGHSVAEAIDAAARITGKAIRTADAPKRPGDPPALIADATRARDELGWRPRHSELHAIIEHAWRWELKKGVAW